MPYTLGPAGLAARDWTPRPASGSPRSWVRRPRWSTCRRAARSRPRCPLHIAECDAGRAAAVPGRPRPHCRLHPHRGGRAGARSRGRGVQRDRAGRPSWPGSPCRRTWRLATAPGRGRRRRPAAGPDRVVTGAGRRHRQHHQQPPRHHGRRPGMSAPTIEHASGGATGHGEPILQRPRPGEALPDQGRRADQADRRRRPRRRRRRPGPLPGRGARAWSVSPAAASPPPGGRSSTCSRPPPARWSSRAGSSSGSAASRCARCAGTSSWSSRTRTPR